MYPYLVRFSMALWPQMAEAVVTAPITLLAGGFSYEWMYAICVNGPNRGTLLRSEPAE
ncbi:hypothetical protein [Caproicibacter sp.]|uniref:hypothetical protein n=1 Tax=Caproicibacter sp. TaxID=2814884 RepID=UPI0039892D8E